MSESSAKEEPKLISGKLDKNARIMVLICTVTYFVSYFTRLDYAATLLEIIRDTGITKENASFAVTGLSIFYAVGQLVSGYLGDRIKPKKLIIFGMFLTCAMNILLPVCGDFRLMTAVWCVNGFAQAMMWPPIVKILASFLTADAYKKACVKVSYGSAFGRMAIYLFAPLCIHFSNWRTVFYIAAALALIMATVLIFKAPDTPVVKRSRETKKDLPDTGHEKKKGSGAGLAAALYLIIPIMLVIILQGVMRDGVETWMPTYVSEQFGLPTENAIFTCVAMPIFTLICYELTSFISRKWLKNEMLCSVAIFGISFICSFLLALFCDKSVILSTVLATLITSCMHGVNLVLTCMVPPVFAKSGRVSFVSGLLNCCTYIGSAAAAYGFAAISENAGWKATIFGWAGICLAAVIICSVLMPLWEKYKNI